MAHTPGKWVTVSGTVETENGTPIAKMDRETGNGTLPVERDDNARLIAAAPEMEKTLLSLLTIVKGMSLLMEVNGMKFLDTPEIIEEEVKKAEEILKKIKGT
jgi:hypothetical protein